MKQICVLFTKYSDLFSTFVYYIGGCGFTHSSIALGEEPDCYYSFNYHGFVVETPEKHRRRGVTRSLCYQLQIPDEAYDKIRMQIQTFNSHKEKFRYAWVGVLFCLLHLPFQWKNHYFCSQFVAELLVESGAVRLRKRACFYLPNQLPVELGDCPYCTKVVMNPI